MITRVRDPDEQFVAASPQRQGMVLANQLFADQALGLRFLVELVQVHQRRAEVLRGDFGDLAAPDHFVLHQIADQRDLLALGLQRSLLRAFVGEQFGEDQLLGQAA
ncbi:hypothetical protein D3C73_922600 [compost metagenome]